MFSPKNRGRNDLTQTDEGIELSQSLLKNGYIAASEIERFPGVVQKAGIHPVIECTQNIPCNPCQDACKFGCIRIGKTITSLPVVDEAADCRNCGMCVASCSGQAIFLIDESVDEEHVNITLPYEFLPIPQNGDIGKALDRSGQAVCDATVIGYKSVPAFDHTALLTIQIPKEYKMQARFYQPIH